MRLLLMLERNVTHIKRTHRIAHTIKAGRDALGQRDGQREGAGHDEKRVRLSIRLDCLRTRSSGSKLKENRWWITVMAAVLLHLQKASHQLLDLVICALL